MRSPCSISAARWPPERLRRFGFTRRWSVLTSAAESLLAVDRLESGYGKIRVLHGIDFTVSPGEVVALLGPNGAGKTTMLRALSGLLPVNAGHVRFDGRDMTNATPREAASAARGSRKPCRSFRRSPRSATSVAAHSAAANSRC